MEFMDHGGRERSRRKLVSLILNNSFENGWMTENEKLRIEDKETFTEKWLELLQLMQDMESDDNAARLLCSIRCFNEMKELFNETGWNEDHFRSLIMMKVYEKGLITQEEKWAFEEKIKGLNDKTIAATHPLNNGLVIKCVMKFLDVKDIATSRVVSKEWSDIGLTVLKSRARITIVKGDYWKADLIIGTLADFYETFPQLPESISFKAFKFGNGWECMWKVEELNEFFKRYQNSIQELELDRIELEGETREDDLNNFDISTWIADSPLAKADNKYNTMLKVESNICDINMASTALLGVKRLLLSFCKIDLIEGAKITPIQLKLKWVSFCRDGNKLPSICINDAFDLSKLKVLYLRSDDDYELDLSGNLNLDFLSFREDVFLKNWDSCKWSVKRMCLSFFSFTEKTQMKITELRFSDSIVDIAALPLSIEELFFECIQGSVFSNQPSQPFVLPNLQYLRLSFIDNAVCETLWNFSDCPNLIALQLENSASTDFGLILSWIPSSVKRLKLKGFAVVNPSALVSKCYVEKLVLQKYPVNDIVRICSGCIQTKELVVESMFSNSEMPNLVFDLLEIQNSNPEFLHRIHIDKFYWNYEKDFLESCLAQRVDSKSAYYLFDQKKGTAITKQQFEKAKNIQKKKEILPYFDDWNR